MFDIFIIGGGPAGMTAAVYAVRAGYKVCVAEKEFSGGQMTKTAGIENYPGFSEIGGFELAMKMEEQAKKAGAEFINTSVNEILHDGADKIIITQDGKRYKARAVILCMGTDRRKLECEGEREFIGKGVSYCATCDGSFFKGKAVAVVGGGDTALEDAEYLSRICERVYLIHRRDQFRGSKVLQQRVSQAENIITILDSVIEKISGDTAVRGISVRNKNTGEIKEIAVSGVFCAVGAVPNTGLVQKIVKTDKNGYIEAGEDCKTSADGIFAAGDLRTKELRQIITAASDGACAVKSAEQYLNGEKITKKA